MNSRKSKQLSPLIAKWHPTLGGQVFTRRRETGSECVSSSRSPSSRNGQEMDLCTFDFKPLCTAYLIYGYLGRIVRPRNDCFIFLTYTRSLDLNKVFDAIGSKFNFFPCGGTSNSSLISHESYHTATNRKHLCARSKPLDT